ncbi:50S ribosomal protein L22 [bacterium]|nr:50S ribosomal protein L22 [bacterium]
MAEETVAQKSGEVKAVAKYIHMAPRKLRLCTRAIVGRNAIEARNLLHFSNKRAAETVERVLVSAISNAVHNNKADAENLIVYRAYVDGGPVGKGWLPRSRGRASQLHKRTSHITIIVKEKEVK